MIELFTTTVTGMEVVLVIRLEFANLTFMVHFLQFCFLLLQSQFNLCSEPEKQHSCLILETGFSILN